MTEPGTGAAVGAIMLALGVAAPLPAFMAGLLIALGSAYVVRAAAAHMGRRVMPLSIAITSGVVVAVLAAILHEATATVWIWGTFPIQAQMGIAGALSQAIAEMAAARGGGLLGKIADKAGLPGEKP